MVSSRTRRRGPPRWLLILLILLLVAPMVAAIWPAAQPASTQPALPVATRLAEGTYRLSGIPGQLLLRGQTVFFTASSTPSVASQRIYALDLDTGQVREVLGNRFYGDGLLDSYRLGLAGDWLVYLEVSAGDNGRSWTLVRHNLATGETAVIDQARDDQAGWPGPEVAADGDWVVWVRKEAAEGGTRSVIRAYSVATGETKQLGPALDATQEAWSWPNLQGGRLVVERDVSQPEQTSSVHLIDLRTGEVTAIPAPAPATEPALAGGYIVWKGALRYAPGPLVVYDLSSQKARTLDLQAEYPRSNGELVVAWVKGSGLVRVDPATGDHQPLAGDDASGFRPGQEVALDGGRAAWIEWAVPEQGQVQARLRVSQP